MALIAYELFQHERDHVHKDDSDIGKVLKLFYIKNIKSSVAFSEIRIYYRQAENDTQIAAAEWILYREGYRQGEYIDINYFNINPGYVFQIGIGLYESNGWSNIYPLSELFRAKRKAVIEAELMQSTAYFDEKNTIQITLNNFRNGDTHIKKIGVAIVDSSTGKSYQKYTINRQKPGTYIIEVLLSPFLRKTLIFKPIIIDYYNDVWYGIDDGPHSVQGSKYAKYKDYEDDLHQDLEPYTHAELEEGGIL